MLSEDEHDMLLNATFQIIDSSLEPHTILDEACALSKRLKLENETSDSLALTENYFSLFHQHGLGSRMEIPAPTLATQIINLLQECRHPENFMLLSDVLLAKFNTILCALKYQSKESFDANLFASMITKHELPLEILWNLHKCSALNLDSYLSSKLLNEAPYTEKLAKKLFALFSGENGNQHRRQSILFAIASCLVKKSFEEKKAPEKRACTQILDKSFRDFLEAYEDTSDFSCLALPLPDEEQIQKETLKKFSIHTLSFLLSHKTNFSVFQALTADTEWKSGKEFGVLRLLLKHLLMPLDVKETANAMFRSLDQPHINPTTVLNLLSVMFMSYPQCKEIITDFIQSEVTSGLENADFDKFCIGLLLARQSAVAGQVYFGRYVDWFESVFGSSCSSLVLTKPMFLMLVKFFSNLVPHESAEYLKVHITKKPHMPLKCKEVYDDYIMLAKTRLRDLGVPLNDVFGRMYDPGQDTINTTSGKSSLDPVEDDIEKVLESYVQTCKIPTTVLEASIFRRPYFVGKFLPALLKPRFLPDEPDLKMKLIEEINKSGRIPTSLYNKYTAECEIEKQNLFEGVFDVDDDAMDALVLSPYEQLTLQLDKYFEAVSHGNKVEEIISMMMETVSGILQNTKSQNSADLSSMLIDFTKPLQIPEIELVKIVQEKLLKVVGIIVEDQEEQPHSFQVLQGVKKFFDVLIHHLPHTAAIIIQHLVSNVHSQVYLDEHHIFTVAWMFVNLAACQPSAAVITVKHRSQSENSHNYTNIIETVYHCMNSQKTVRLYFIYSCFMRYTHLALRLLDGEAQQQEDADVFEVVPQLETEQLLPTFLMEQLLLLKMRFSLCERFLNQSHLPSQILPEDIESSVTLNPIWKKVTSKLQPSLQDWISFEIKIDESCDSLSPSERASVMWKISSQFLQSAKLSKKPLDFHSEMLRILAQNLASCSSEPLCKGKKKVVEVIRMFINILKHHTSQLSQIGQVTGNWVASTLQSFISLPYTNSLLRILLELPPHLVFSNAPSKMIAKSDVESALYIVKQYCNSNHNEGGFLSLDSTMYFMQSLMSVQSNVTSSSVLSLFISHPVISLSVLVHLTTLKELGLLLELPEITTLMDVYDQAVSMVEGLQSFSSKLPSYQLGSALFAIISNRKRNMQINQSILSLPEKCLQYILEIISMYSTISWDYERIMHPSPMSQLFIDVVSSKSDLLIQLLDPECPTFATFRADLGLGGQVCPSHARDLFVLSLTSNIQASVLLKYSTKRLTSAVFTAYTRVVDSCQVEGSNDFELNTEGTLSHLCKWIKQLVDLTGPVELQIISVPPLNNPGSHVVLYRYIIEKKKGWI